MVGTARPSHKVAGGTIPAHVNPASGSAKAALEALERHPGFEVRLTPPERLTVALRQAVSAGAPRVLVAGGDGTISSAASVLARTSTALGVLPGGTLNHFARDHGIPTDPDEALRLAEHGRASRVEARSDPTCCSWRPAIGWKASSGTGWQASWRASGS
jgi:diacylglycerol kinase family enzyme